MKTQQDIIHSLPKHLRPFVAQQNYADYTPRDQAVWRFLLHQLVENLRDSAHPLYLEGLQGAGIDIEYIPRIETINHHLEQIGWRATVVDGFIPPAIFIEFLAHKVLVIAVDIRSIDTMLYTPAPDIIHESAGHAPFIIDVDYAEYLERVGKLGRRVITSKADIETYEAIRALSIIKESPEATTEDVLQAQDRLNQTITKYQNTAPSEAALLSRLQWWTTEYGLVGSVKDYRIFGAGLLSSLGESLNCLDDNQVKKIPLTVDAIAMPYDITNEQPHLFVARNCRHLSQIAEQFANSMSYFKGGAASLQKAIEAATVNTAVFRSGLEVSGCFTQVITDSAGSEIYLKTTGPTQLAYQEKELPGHGRQFHSDGFGSPVGKLQSSEKCLSTYSIDELEKQGIVIGTSIQLEFLSGISVSGFLTHIVRRDGRNLLFSFRNCTVTQLDGTCLFAPSWGTYDMAIGDSISAVYGGAADQDNYPLYEPPARSGATHIEHDAATTELFELYRSVRAVRESQSNSRAEVQALTNRYQILKNNDWLITFELLELHLLTSVCDQSTNELGIKLKQFQDRENDDTKQLIQYGLNRLLKLQQA